MGVNLDTGLILASKGTKCKRETIRSATEFAGPSSSEK
jgi:hypothetical protein